MQKELSHKITYDEEFLEIIEDLLENEVVQEMRKYTQHKNTNRLEHCKSVAYYTYLIARRLDLDYVSATRGAILHDLFLYNWRHTSVYAKRISDLHAFAHPRVALKNAERITSINPIEKDVILKHMWPLTIILPKYKESYVIMMVDKYCTIQEFFNMNFRLIESFVKI